MELTDSVSTLPFVGPTYEKKLKKLDILTIFDLLHHIPHRYIDFSKFIKIKDIRIDELISVFGEIKFIKNQPTKSGKLMQIATLEDETGQINLIWFNQYFLIKTLYPNSKLIISGKASWFNRKLAFFNPVYEKIDYPHQSVHTGKIVGVYPATAGLSNKWLKARIKYALDRVNIDEFLKDKKDMYLFSEAIDKIHFPKTINEANKARERLSFNEFFEIIKKAKERKNKLINKQSVKLTINQTEIDKYIRSLPFKLTNSQQEAVDEIISGLKNNYPMNRLLQGDVGSGKTVIGLILAKLVIDNGYQVAMLAPTQLLANQHFNTIKSLLPMVKPSLITANSKKTINNSEFLVGTHALINQSKILNNLGLLIIDEQHKFGVKQIEFAKNINPHKLTMTATPIPRTIAQTLYSDMDISIIKEKPGNKAKIKTWLVPNEKREKAYTWIKEQVISNKSQVFVICPLVEESTTETMKDVKNVIHEFHNLKFKIKNLKFGLLHGRMKEKDKNKVLTEFKDGKLDVLVSTPVVEVGIDVPNATIMLIEAADRFGLAQLHQLRGRVGRSDKQSYCLLFSESENEKSIERLNNLAEISSGFELAEIDFKLRGAGEVLGLKQHGIGELKIADWSDTNLIKLATQAVNSEV